MHKNPFDQLTRILIDTVRGIPTNVHVHGHFLCSSERYVMCHSSVCDSSHNRLRSDSQLNAGHAQRQKTSPRGPTVEESAPTDDKGINIR